MAYCEEADLLLGNIPIADYVSKSKYISDAADEIDSMIGSRYVTPVNLADTAENRPARLLLKRINAHLASGRLIMALDAGGQDDRLHAYGYSLVQQALAALAALVDGTADLGAAPVIPDPNANSVTVPVVISNIDPESQVEAFYARVAGPFPVFGYGEAESRIR